MIMNHRQLMYCSGCFMLQGYWYEINAFSWATPIHRGAVWGVVCPRWTPGITVSLRKMGWFACSVRVPWMKWWDQWWLQWTILGSEWSSGNLEISLVHGVNGDSWDCASQSAWALTHRKLSEFDPTDGIDPAWVTSLFDSRMVLPGFCRLQIHCMFLTKQAIFRHGIARPEAGLGRFEHQESGEKAWFCVGGLWLEGQLKNREMAHMENHVFFFLIYSGINNKRWPMMTNMALNRMVPNNWIWKPVRTAGWLMWDESG